MGPHEDRVEGNNHFPCPAGHPSSDAAQDTAGFLGCKCTLLAHVQLFVPQSPQFLLHRAALKEFFSQCVHIAGIAPKSLHLALLNLISFMCIHFLILSRSFWIASLPSILSAAPFRWCDQVVKTFAFAAPFRLVTSIILLIVLLISLSMPLTKMLEGTGPIRRIREGLL